MARTALTAGRFGEAEAICEQLRATGEGGPEPTHILGLLAHLAGRRDDAIALLGAAVAASPSTAVYRHNLGEAYLVCGRFAAARVQYQSALTQEPSYAKARNGLGAALYELGRTREALDEFRQVIAEEPGLASAHINAAIALEALGKPAKAVASYERAAELEPAHPQLALNFANSLQSCGEPARAIELLRERIDRDSADRVAHSNLLLYSHYLSDDPAALFAEHRRWDEAHAAGIEPLPALPPRDPRARLRVGYVTPDLAGHPVGFFARPLLEAHDRTAVETFVYADRGRRGSATWLQEAPEHFRDTTELSDRALAHAIRDDAVDVLVDLAGHTRGGRLLPFAYRPAPVQVTYCGYIDTTGLDAMDYRVTDARADPPGQSDSFHSETLLRLPGGFLCYRPPEDAPAPAAAPSLTNGFVTFGSFNHLPKMTPDVVRVWSRVLDAIPDSRLLLKSMAFEEAALRERTRARFAEQGIIPERVTLEGWSPSIAAHLKSYARVDLALDTFPYVGATTTCEALWMGVPVVTLAGSMHVGRVGVSLLSQVGLGDLVAADRDEFVRIASDLACAPNQLAELRSGLRERMAASPLCDSRRLAGELEAAFFEAVRQQEPARAA